MDFAAARRSIAWRTHVARRQLARARAEVRIVRTDLELLSTAGYRLQARLFRPEGTGTLPGLVISPAIHHGLAEVEGFGSAVSADEVARLGYAVLAYDPAGRGGSWGEEDFGGEEQQDDLRVAVRALWADGAVESVAVLSLSFGIVAAAGALARWGPELRVRWLLDWEGPCDREIITTGGTRLVPAAGHSLDDDAYWAPREPVRHVGRLRCGYVRLQADPDHAQPRELRHAERMLRAVAAGTAPWFQINDHPRGQIPARPAWIAGGPTAANAALLRKLTALR